MKKKSSEVGGRDRGVASSLERAAFRVRIGTVRHATGAGKTVSLASRIRAMVMKRGAGMGRSGGGKRFSTGRGGRAAAQFAARLGRQRVSIKASTTCDGRCRRNQSGQHWSDRIASAE